MIKISKKGKTKNTTLFVQFQNQTLEKGKIDTHKTHIHDPALSWILTGTSIKKNVG